MATPHNSAEKGAFAKTVLMPGDPLRAKLIAETFLTEPKLVNNVRGIQGYTGTYKGVPVSVMASGMGACTNSCFANQYRLPGTFAPICNFDLLTMAVEAAGEIGVRMPVGNLFSSDTFYDAAASTMEWAKMGCMAVEMEAAALYCNAAYTHKRALAICSISDSLVTGEELNAEERQNSFTNMMKIALEIAVKATKLPDLEDANVTASK